MHLVTTAVRKYWKQGCPTLFLGEWCKLFKDRGAWGEIPHSVAPYHWNDRERLLNDYRTISRLYEEILESLGQRLNAIHGVRHSARYWRIVLGPWLFLFMHLLYDRYLSICAAGELGGITSTWISDPPYGAWTPSGLEQLTSRWHTDEYNHFLYSRIIQGMGTIPFECIETDGPLPACKVSDDRSVAGFGKAMLQRAVSAYAGLVSSRVGSVAIFDSYFHPVHLLQLQLALGQLPYFRTMQIQLPAARIDFEWRQKLRTEMKDNSFAAVLNVLIAEQLPTAYMEHYAELRELSLRRFPKNAKAILSGDYHVGREDFKLWAAEQVEQGTRLFLHQHGGGFGSCSWCDVESVERAACDRYYTWGWTDSAMEKITPMPVMRSSAARLIGHIRPRPDGDIVWVQVSNPRYFYRSFASPVGPQMLDYLEDQRRFLDGLPLDVKRILRLRLALGSYWEEEARWKDIAPDLRITKRGELPLSKELEQCRLAVVTYNGTCHLELIAANYPTIIFWNPKHWELRPNAARVHAELAAVGILHESPESAAAKVNEIWEDPQTWWKTPAVRAAVEAFREQFARTDPAWLRRWRSQLAADAL